MELSGERKTWPLQAAQAQRWVGTKDGASWVLAGDAAHNVHPLAGQGLNLGLGDVAELVKILDHRAYWRRVGDLKLLRAYERARKADFAVVGGSGDALQQLFGQQHPAWQALRKIGMLGFERSGPLKRWVTDRAMGTTHRTSGIP
jgi:2-polyprenyl-6-methoxyphenol hydroxylase-like FAD-dependent oxidoreductase